MKRQTKLNGENGEERKLSKRKNKNKRLSIYDDIFYIFVAAWQPEKLKKKDIIATKKRFGSEEGILLTS